MSKENNKLTRGLFSSLINNDIYRESEKVWIVELQRFYTYWLGLLDNPLEGISSREFLIQYLSAVRKQVEENLEKRFVYFICSKKRVRFDISKPPRYGIFDRKLKLCLLVGKKKKISVKLDLGVSKDDIKPTIDITEEFFTLTADDGSKFSLSVHDFVDQIGLNLGHSTKVEYVGYTKSPEIRPTNGEHTGLNDVLRRVSNEDNDIFITFNLFRVYAYATGHQSMLNFMMPNSMTDEITVDLEGRILEKCFIFYFDSDNQFRNKPKERAELINSLQRLSSDNKIRSVHICYEPDDSGEPIILYSSKVEPRSRHVFNVKLDDNKLCITPGSEHFPK